MRGTIKKWTLRLTVTGFLIIGILLGIVMNPGLLYANKTTINNYTVYHHSQLDKKLIDRVDNAIRLVKKSELYDSDFKLEICLNDGSYYPSLIEKLRGQAFAWGFYNKGVLQGELNYTENYAELNGYRWNLEQLLAHESIHCYQFNKYGFWGSNPIADYPNWKWEGYPEYISRQGRDQQELFDNIERLVQYRKEKESERVVKFADSTIVPINYYKDWMLVQYCLDVKEMTYEELLNDTVHKKEIEKEMLDWFHKKK